MARTQNEMLAMLAVMTDLSVDSDEAVLALYSEIAEDLIMRRLYPFGAPEGATLPSSLEVKALEVAAYMILKRGAEGQTAHKENGVDRTYDARYVPDDMLREVIPMAVAVGGDSSETGN